MSQTCTTARPCTGGLLTLLFLLGAFVSYGQVANLPNNEPVIYTNPKTPALSIVTGSAWTSDAPFLTFGGTANESNAIDSDVSNFASLVRATVGGGTQRITVAVRHLPLIPTSLDLTSR